ncbi:hypothetical protein PSEUBRA_001247 [Kalmanozyma brasiliensis GHG001]|uniref:uncharacterized protein n=1 Tax=Kalmanozyma brasiliensis (strain GHG001) TaxID=1365824 RepID=UPI002867B1CD|nr:uncharacterized protein PSEUBRA_001247 [Kalmanozyma brasiliensis GHG001]KAF6766910.1 hypothetical protein PSEUBRA_001247 [Kalmanozyma brasiliensis GHG001]
MLRVATLQTSRTCSYATPSFGDWSTINPDEDRPSLCMTGRYGDEKYQQPCEPWDIPAWPLKESTSWMRFDFMSDWEYEEELWHEPNVNVETAYDGDELICFILADRSQELERHAFVWDLPDKDAVRDRLLEQPREVLARQAVVGVIERSLAAPGSLRAYLAALVLRQARLGRDNESSTDAPSCGSQASITDSSRRSLPRRVTGTQGRGDLLRVHKDGTFVVGWSNEQGACFEIEQLYDVRPLLVALSNASGSSRRIRSVISAIFGSFSAHPAKPLLEEKVAAFIFGQEDARLDVHSMGAFFCRLAAEHRNHFPTKRNPRALVVGLDSFHVLPKPKKKDSIIYVRITGGYLVSETRGPSGERYEDLTVAIDRYDSFFCKPLPKLGDILASLGMTLFVYYDKDQDDDFLVNVYEEVSKGRAIRALLYYPIAQQLAARTYEESLRIAEAWKGVQSLRHPHRTRPHVTTSPQGEHAVVLDTGRKIEGTPQVRFIPYSSKEEAERANRRLQNYLNDKRLGALDPHDIFCVWNLFDGPGSVGDALSPSSYDSEFLKALLESLRFFNARTLWPPPVHQHVET